MGRAKRTFQITFGAVITALGVLFLYLSCLSLFARWSLVAVAGLLPAAAVISADRRTALAVWAATGVLGFLLLPDRLNAALYLLFFGIYPVVKSLLEQLKSRWLVFLCKLAFFNAILAIFINLLTALFMPAVPWDVQEHIYLAYLWGSVIFLIYDFGFSKLIRFYIVRIDNVINKR